LHEPALPWENKTVANCVVAQPFSWKAGLLFVLTGAGLVWYFENEKKRMHSKRIAESNKGVGRPKVGGPFELIDQDGNRVTDQDLKGRYSLVSRGVLEDLGFDLPVLTVAPGLLWLHALPRHLPRGAG
jgi:hypothetical protein